MCHVRQVLDISDEVDSIRSHKNSKDIDHLENIGEPSKKHKVISEYNQDENLPLLSNMKSQFENIQNPQIDEVNLKSKVLDLKRTRIVIEDIKACQLCYFHFSKSRQLIDRIFKYNQGNYQVLYKKLLDGA